MRSLKVCVHDYEKHHGVKIEDEALEAAVKMSQRYINDRFLPDKAIDIIDEQHQRFSLRVISQHLKWNNMNWN